MIIGACESRVRLAPNPDTFPRPFHTSVDDPVYVVARVNVCIQGNATTKHFRQSHAPE